MKIDRHNFLALLRGDLRLFMRDQLAILLAVVLPIVSIPLMLGGVDEATEAGEQDLRSRTIQIEAPEILDSWLEDSDHLERTEAPFVEHPEEDVDSAAAALEIQAEPFQVTIRYRGNDSDSREARSRLVEVLQREQNRQQTRHWNSRGIDIDPSELVVVIERDISSPEARAAHAIGKWLAIFEFSHSQPR